MQLAIYGATGFTGGLLVEEARRRGLRPILAGRRREALEAQAAQWDPALEIRLANPHDRPSLDAMLEGVDILITTVGPFTDYGLPVAFAAVEHGVHYLDTTGEQTFMADCRALFNATMRAQQRLMINAAAFEYTPGTLGAARLLAETGPAKRIDITYDMGMGGGAASRGTLKSILRLVGAEGITFRDGAFVPMHMLDAVRNLQMPSSNAPQPVVLFPGGEVLAVPRFAQVQDVQTWIAVPAALPRMGRLSQRLLASTQDGLLYSALSTLINRLPSGPDQTIRNSSAAHIVLETEHGSATMQCRDPYGVTAKIAIDLAWRISHNEAQAFGVISAAEAFDPAAMWAMLERCGVTYNSP